jgi:hypothetical protein
MPTDPSPTSWPDATPIDPPIRHDDLPACSAPPIPLGPCPVCPRLAQEFEPWRQAAYWQAMHQRAVQRENLLHQENEQLHARIRFLEQQRFSPLLTAARSRSGEIIDDVAASTEFPGVRSHG